MKLGARILKTGIAIVIALLVSQLLGIPSPVFAGIAAVFAVQPTIYRSYLSIIEQIQANLIGAGIAVLFVLLFGSNPLIVGLAAVIAIAIILKMKLQNTIGLALVTMIAIMEVTDQDFIQFALIRFSTIMIGVFSSFFVNLIFLPPKYETKLYHKVADSTEEILKWIRLSTRHATEFHLLKRPGTHQRKADQGRPAVPSLQRRKGLFQEKFYCEKPKARHLQTDDFNHKPKL